MTRFLFILVFASRLVIAQTTSAAPDADAPAYLGLTVRDTPDGLVVGWIHPGPLGGESFTSASGIRRGDNVVSVNTQPVDASGFQAAIDILRPGDTVTIVLRRSPQADPNAAVPKGGPGGEPFTVTATLADRRDWTGTIGRGLGERAVPTPGEGAFEAMILRRAAELGARDAEGGLDALLANLRQVQDKALDPNGLDAVINVFRRPLSIDEQERTINESIRAIVGPDRLSETPMWAKLMSSAAELIGLEEPAGLSSGAAHAILDQHGKVVQRLEGGYGDRATGLVRHMRTSFTLDNGKSAGDHIRVIADSEHTLVVHLLWDLNTHRDRLTDLERVADQLTGAPDHLDPAGAIPDPLSRAVKGDVLGFEERHDGRFFVIGGPESNRYDMSIVCEIVDVGGDDQYVWPDAPTPGAEHWHRIFDLAGNDVYESRTDFAGPATAVFGLSLIDDHAGNDSYRSSAQFTIGAGLFGIGVLLDRAGDDRYENLGPDSGWSTGVGFYGVGLVIDQAGNDVYHAEKLSQGVGAPRGFGAVLDRAGNDRYEADGPSFGSAYGTPGVHLGMSQGFGFGVRGYAAGGIGAIYDDAGDDHYIAGEFSQAGGYYFGLGILHDHAGNDRYRGNRYGQAFAAHQAAGILIDDAGNDSYWSMTAASQSGGWDQSITMLLDHAGDDVYHCEGLGLGAASMQAIGIFLDLQGADRYEASPGATLGQSGGNSYHYDADQVFSFSAFFDRSGGDDAYPQHRANDAAHPTGARNESAPKDSGLYGIFVDE